MKNLNEKSVDVTMVTRVKDWALLLLINWTCPPVLNRPNEEKNQEKKIYSKGTNSGIQ